MSQSCGAVDTDHSTNGNLTEVNFTRNKPPVGYLCDNHRSTNSWCPVCKQFMRNAEMYINSDFGIQVCLPDALSSRSVALYTDKLGFALKSDVTAQAATINTLQQSINSIKNKLNLV